MMETKYYPLVAGDTESADMYPLFPSGDGAGVAERHGYYLMEMFPRFYTLCRGEKETGREEAGIRVRCPRCGKEMDMIAPGRGKGKGPVYMCRACTEERKV